MSKNFDAYRDKWVLGFEGPDGNMKAVRPIPFTAAFCKGRLRRRAYLELGFYSGSMFTPCMEYQASILLWVIAVEMVNSPVPIQLGIIQEPKIMKVRRGGIN